MSVTDILVALYFKHMNVGPEKVNDPDRDVLSFFQGSLGGSSLLCPRRAGFFPYSDLETVSQFKPNISVTPTTRLTALRCAPALSGPRAAGFA